MLPQKLIEHSKALDFITAGNATFTVKSLKTGVRFTYKVTMPEDNDNMLFINLLTGTDNESSYSYIFHLYQKDGVPMLVHSKKARITEDAPACVAFKYVFYNLLVGKEMPLVEIWHEGRCGRCGRKLTVPESIDSGYGPECIDKVRLFQL